MSGEPDVLAAMRRCHERGALGKNLDALADAAGVEADDAFAALVDSLVASGAMRRTDGSAGYFAYSLPGAEAIVAAAAQAERAVKANSKRGAR